MRGITQPILNISVAVAVLLTASVAMAQNDQNNPPQRQGRRGQRNFDPAQFQQRMMDRYKERLEITDDSEWKAIEPLIQKVFDARMAVGVGRGGFGRGGTGRGGRRGGDAGAADNTTQQARNPGRSNPAAEALQRAIESKAPAAEIKAALTRYIEDRKSKQAELEKAQAALRAVLTSRQEAIATISGLL
ncbi:MAG: hypothetical protein ACREIC_28385 [Limisphaerales bacterium]